MTRLPRVNQFAYLAGSSSSALRKHLAPVSANSQLEHAFTHSLYELLALMANSIYGCAAIYIDRLMLIIVDQRCLIYVIALRVCGPQHLPTGTRSRS